MDSSIEPENGLDFGQKSRYQDELIAFFLPQKMKKFQPEWISIFAILRFSLKIPVP